MFRKHFVMDLSRDISTAELLLEVMEHASLGPQSRRELSRELRRAHPVARADRRVDRAIEILESEGLLASEDVGGEIRHHTTRDGLAVLEQKGRFTAAATVLFTDIADSTALIDRVGEAEAHEVRRRHFALLRKAVTKFGGREVKNLGDGLMVVFAKTPPAIECAGRMQRDVANDTDELGLRVGLHAGELLRDGNDYFGSTVIIARRLCDLAAPGQTIASLSTCEPVVTDSGRLGQLALKGLSEPVEAVSLPWSPAAAGAT